MYCSSCGTALAQELSYCNRCGAKLSSIKGSGASKSLEKSVESTMWSIVGVTVTMLGIMIPVMALMIGAGLSREVITLFMALMFLMLLGIDGVFIWQLLRFNNRARETGGAPQLEGLGTKELGAKREQAFFEPMMSVTENATRILEPTGEERRTK